MITGTYAIHRIKTEEEAERIVEFFFSPHSFDDTRYTPGEEEQLRSLPYRALSGQVIFWYAKNEDDEIIGASCMAENDQKTGGYSWDYVVVHRDYRRWGIAATLLDHMLGYLRESSARYLMTYTCSLPEYKAIRNLFERNEFQLIGRCPDYYFEGEDRLIYWRRIS
ncbi:GNAT family N-acetyltransferase [Cohnella lupini]|uniref:Acetyltransferase (GNAT) family protein n=1 Tax=Cohnella lupini TaxID=1294267 RepID=A0A3D9I527_9BACL|nr:GNAT family N-acetyltransferase [Cohnella lupini]RED56781.1 acetyltransferase (GNAT) family protein [Cohnella lupini]